MAAALALAAMPLGAGCADNRLPQVPVPRPDASRPLPAWYPEKPWSAKDGDSGVYIEGKIVFEVDRAMIRSGSEKVLATLLGFLREHPEVTRLRVEGHTDSTASEPYNQELSARRALAVCDWLVDRGVDHMRLLAVGLGESRPLAPNELALGRAENRRTAFHVAEVNGRPFMGNDPSAGGLALEVRSAEERRAAKQRPPAPAATPPTKPFTATGDEVKMVDQPSLAKKRGDGGT